MQTPAAPRGTRDFYPEEMAIREHIFSSWQSTCRRFGFEAVDGPQFEHTEVYTQKSGEGIEEQLYAFEDKGGRQIALRPEFTPTLARMVAARGPSLKLPIRWYSIPRLFRYEKMQRGRLREFFQLNMDILGCNGVCADAELIAASAAMMFDLGFDDNDFRVHISSRTLLEELFLKAGVPSAALVALYALLDKRDKMPAESYQIRMREIVTEPPVHNRVERILEARTLDDIERIDETVPSYTQLRSLFSLLDSYHPAVPVQFDTGVVRGLAYYTGTVFELFDTRRTMRAIAGGGRYDKLVGLYGGPPTPAVGFAAGDVVLANLMREKGIPFTSVPRSDVFVVGIADAWPADVIKVASLLRHAGMTTEFALRKGAIGKQLKHANAARSRIVVFVGGEEGARKEVKLKVMHSGHEETVPLEAAAQSIALVLAHSE